jgi:hypothetical protein
MISSHEAIVNVGRTIREPSWVLCFEYKQLSVIVPFIAIEINPIGSNQNI